MTTKALLIGINAYPTSPLYGCVNDVRAMWTYLTRAEGVRAGDIGVILDADATRARLVDRLGAFVRSLRPGDRGLLYYAGHGSIVATPNDPHNTHEDCLCPVDFVRSGMLTAGELRVAMARAATGAELRWISDSCHSGGLLTVPAGGRSHPPGRVRATLRHVAMAVDATLLAACGDDEIAWDVTAYNRRRGVLTFFLLEELWSLRGLSLQDVVSAVSHRIAAAGFLQEPVLTGPAGSLLSRSLVGARRAASAP